jgi:PAT family beta-lactamase induction signal transducer AmpG
MNAPNAVYVAFAFWKPSELGWICSGVAVEQFGYGFGFTAYLMYMIHIARGPHQTAHYAICTGFMALGMMLPGMVSGALQEWLGYREFFLWVMVATVPSFVVCALIPLEPDFGKRASPQ